MEKVYHVRDDQKAALVDCCLCGMRLAVVGEPVGDGVTFQSSGLHRIAAIGRRCGACGAVYCNDCFYSAPVTPPAVFGSTSVCRKCRAPMRPPEQLLGRLAEQVALGDATRAAAAGACCACGRDLSGALGAKSAPLSRDEVGPLIDRERIVGYRCNVCKVMYCAPCATSMPGYGMLHEFAKVTCRGCNQPIDKPEKLLRPDLALVTAVGWQEVAHGGGIGQSSVTVHLFEDRLLVFRFGGVCVDRRVELVFAQLASAEIQLCEMKDGRWVAGSLALSLMKKGFLGRLAPSTETIRFTKDEEDKFVQIHQSVLRGMSGQSVEPAPAVRRPVPPSAPQQAAQPSRPGGTVDAAMLEKLAELHKKGILTDEEFAAKKRQILGL